MGQWTKIGFGLQHQAVSLHESELLGDCLLHRAFPCCDLDKCVSIDGSNRERVAAATSLSCMELWKDGRGKAA